MKAIAQARQRYRRLLELLHEEDSTAAELAARLRPAVTTHQVHKDLCLLREWFPTQLIEEPGMDARRHSWRLVGLPPQPLTETLDYLTHDELTALIAARGMFRQPDTRNPGWERPASGNMGVLP